MDNAGITNQVLSAAETVISDKDLLRRQILGQGQPRRDAGRRDSRDDVAGPGGHRTEFPTGMPRVCRARPRGVGDADGVERLGLDTARHIGRGT